MSKKKVEAKPKKVQILFEAEVNPTKCCECLFGGTCPYSCAFAGKLDCATYDLGSIKVVEIKTVEG